ncbi:MAG: uroporphyrinogen decarboxylase family protein [Eggerthellales bacterium]|nr:uroporphyrinogen decarboxylase family protein [Eggerthellales bacterium]
MANLYDVSSDSRYAFEGDKMTMRENAMAILRGEQPEYYFDIMSAAVIVPDPHFIACAIPKDGELHVDPWGVTRCFPVGAPGAHPFITDENKVIKDIEDWREQIILPPVEGLDWSAAKAKADSVDRTAKFVCLFSATGLFERSHFLMGMEDAFCSYLEDPDEMYEMLEAVCDWKIRYIHEAAKQIHPDMIFYQDDWGSKQNLFLPPNVWREIIKPLHTKIVEAAHEEGMLFVHHADCICEPIVEDMCEMGIDVWADVIPQNDIVAIKKIVNGRMCLKGGADCPVIDSDSVSEEEVIAEIHRVIDTYCPGGYFYPALSNSTLYNSPRNDALAKAELKRYGRQWAQEHPDFNK